jgi:hypothetical protein
MELSPSSEAANCTATQEIPSLGLPSCLLPSGFPTNILYAFIFSPIHSTFPAHLCSTRYFVSCMSSIPLSKRINSKPLTQSVPQYLRTGEHLDDRKTDRENPILLL